MSTGCDHAHCPRAFVGHINPRCAQCGRTPMQRVPAAAADGGRQGGPDVVMGVTLGPVLRASLDVVHAAQQAVTAETGTAAALERSKIDLADALVAQVTVHERESARRRALALVPSATPAAASLSPTRRRASA